MPIPFFAAFAESTPNIDWRDELSGERYGFTSPVQRASEMPHAAGIMQIGIRSVGSARKAEVDAAIAYGSKIVTAREIYEEGV